MLLCCLLPVGFLLAIFVFNIPVGTVVSLGIFLLCPILHLLLMKKMGHHNSSDHKEECMEASVKTLPANEKRDELAPGLPQVNEKATALTRARYQRLAYFYDFMESLFELRFRKWRESLWPMVEGSAILEVGVGTGKNMPYWPAWTKMTGIDLTPGMLEIAHVRAKNLGLNSELHLADVQALDFPDNSFDAAVATFVFCSVPNPILGFSELNRVVKSGGHIFLIEHVRSTNWFLGGIMDLINPLFVRLMGANINRQTLENIQGAGLQVVHVVNLTNSGIFKLIVARTVKQHKNGDEELKSCSHELPDVVEENLVGE